MMELAAVLVLFIAAHLLAERMGRRKSWYLPFLAALAAVTLVLVGHRSMRLSMVPPIAWAIDATISPLLMSLAIPLLLATLTVRLKHRRQRILVRTLMLAMVGAYCVLPIASPLLARASLLATRTRSDTHGICLQAHTYTCGPASAVTCLRALGIPAEEGPLAAAASAGPCVGTDPLRLRDAINAALPHSALRCTYRYAESLDSLTTPCIATMWVPPLGGHYVAVLQISADAVIVGDPFCGRTRWSRQEFEQDWRHAVHEFIRPASPVTSSPAPLPLNQRYHQSPGSAPPGSAVWSDAPQTPPAATASHPPPLRSRKPRSPASAS